MVDKAGQLIRRTMPHLQRHPLGPPALPHLQGPGWIDLLVTDVGLPGVNGRRLARQHRPQLRVLLMTGDAPGAM